MLPSALSLSGFPEHGLFPEILNHRIDCR